MCFFDVNRESYFRLNDAQRVTRNTDSNYVPTDGQKNQVLRLAREFHLEKFFLFHEIDNLEIKFWAKNTLVASYSRAVIA